MSIWEKLGDKAQPVPKEDIDKLRKSVRENVIKPMMERRKRQAQLIDEVRRRVVF